MFITNMGLPKYQTPPNPLCTQVNNELVVYPYPATGSGSPAAGTMIGWHVARH